MEKIRLKPIRNSRMEFNQIYFWTDTIKDWKHLLKKEKYKLIIIDELKRLVDKQNQSIWLCNYAKPYSFTLGIA